MKLLRIFPQVVVSCLLLVWLSGCATLLDELPAKSPPLTLQEEKKLGETCLPVAIQRLGGPYADPVLDGYLGRVGKVLTQRVGRSNLDYQFLIVDRNEAGLYTLPGGKVLVSRGLLQQINNESGYAAVLEHAIVRTTDAPFAGMATRRMVEQAHRVLQRPQKKAGPELDSPADVLARAIISRDEANIIDLGAITHQGSPIAGKLKLTDQERQAFAELQALQPGYQLLDRAKRLEADGEQRAAIAGYLQAAVEAPGQAGILSELGMAYLRADDLSSARVHLQKAARLQPDFYRTRMGLGYLRLQAGDLEGALAHLRASVQLLPVTENFFLLGQVHEKLGQPSAALHYYRAITENDPRSKLGRAASERVKELERTL